MKKITFLIYFFFPIICFSQTDFKPGFIIKNNGDTLKGYLEPIETKKISNTISYTLANSGQPQTFTTEDIKAFGYDVENTFERVYYTNLSDFRVNKLFAKSLSKGYYSLYTFWEKDIKYFIIKTPDDSCHFLYDDNMASSGFMHEKGNFKNQLLYFSISCNELKPSIDRLEYNESTLISYIAKLNKCVSPSTTNNVVYKKEKSQLSVYAYAGGMALGNGHEYTGRILGRLTVPSVDKNISLNFGVNYMDYQKTTLGLIYVNGYPGYRHETTSKTIFSIPLTIQYYFTNGFIKPYLDAGLTFDYIKNENTVDARYSKPTKETKFGPAFTAALGIEGYITKQLAIKADYRYELFVHYPTVGVAYFIK